LLYALLFVFLMFLFLNIFVGHLLNGYRDYLSMELLHLNPIGQVIYVIIFRVLILFYFLIFYYLQFFFYFYFLYTLYFYFFYIFYFSFTFCELYFFFYIMFFLIHHLFI